MMSFIGKLLKSKTIIVNTLAVVAGTMTYLSGNEVIAQNPEIVAGLVTALGVVNVILRLVTKIPVSEK
jgi:hypothetical protein